MQIKTSLVKELLEDDDDDDAPLASLEVATLADDPNSPSKVAIAIFSQQRSTSFREAKQHHLPEV